MDKITIWHNARCSKSRKTLVLIEDHGFEPEVVRYLETPPGLADLECVIRLLDCGPRDILRTKEVAYTELNLAAENDEQKLKQAMVENPVLIERPIVVRGDRAVIGRPPENVLPLLEKS